MKTGLRQGQVQVQKLSPQQIQLMKLLQVPTVLLEQRIKEELEINPVLEEGSPGETDEFGGAEGGMEQQEEERTETAFEPEDYVNEYLDQEEDSYKTWGDQYQTEESITLVIWM